MSAMTFVKATKKTAKARVALMGPSGSGKTKTGLRIAAGLGKRIAVIDTENASAAKYAGDDGIDFDVLCLDSHSPENYVEAIHAAERAGYEVIFIDSLSHAWSGRDGALEQVDKAAKRSQSGNSYTAWRDVTPKHNALVDALVRCKAHLIASMRTKTEYVLEDVVKNGKTSKQPRRIGLAPIQRDGMEYEFDVVADITLDHDLMVTKTRCSALDGMVVNKAGEGFGEILAGWLSDGEAAAPALEVVPTEEKTPTLVSVLNDRKAEIDARKAASDRPDTRPARRAEPKPETKPEDASPVVGGRGPHAGKRMSVLSDSELIDIVRQMMHVAATPKWAAEMAPKIAAAKAYAATRNIVDFSVSKEERAKQLAAAVKGQEHEYSDEMYMCENHGMYGNEPGMDDVDIRKWLNPEKLVEYINWLRATYNQPTQTGRIACAEECLEKLVKDEAARAEKALAKK